MVLMIALLSTIALSSYMHTTSTFRFLSEYKQLRSPLDLARAYAITNRQVRGQVPDRYGVCISANSVVVFADVGELPMRFDPDLDFERGACKRVAEGPEGEWEFERRKKIDVVILSHVFGEEYSIKAFEFEEDISTEAENLLAEPVEGDDPFVLIFYESGGSVSVIHDDIPISTADAEFFLVFQEEGRSQFEKTIKIYLMTGLADEI